MTRTALALALVSAGCSHASATPPAAPAVLEADLGPPERLPNPMRIVDATRGEAFTSCYRTFQPVGDVLRDLSQMTALCGPPNAMHAVTPVLQGRQSATEPLARFTFRGETGRCYRVFAAADRGVADLDMAVLDPDHAVVGHDTNADAFPILNPDGPLCLTRPGAYTLLVSVERGEGRYALQVWGF